MGRLAAALLLLAACSGKEAAPTPAEGTAPATAAEVAAPPIDAPIDRYRALAMPEITSGLETDAVTGAPIAVIAILQVSFEGAPVVRVMGGKIDPKAVDDRRVIAALSELYATYHKATTPPPALVNLAVVPQLNVGVALDVMTSIAAGGQRRFALLVRTPERTGALPLSLYDGGLEVGAIEVVITDEDVKVVRDGRTLHTVPAAADPWPALRAKLVEVAGAQRGAPLLVRIAEGRKVSVLTAALMAVRADEAGQPLFPDVVLARWTPPASAASAMMTEDEAAAFANMLTSDGAESAGDMSGRQPGSDLAAQLDAVIGTQNQVAIGGGDPRGTRSDPDAAAAAWPTGRITLSSKKSFDDTSLTEAAVAQKVLSAYMPGLKRCYKNALKANPDIAGTLAIDLTVNELGRAEPKRVATADRGQQQCVAGLVANWRFAIPKDQDGEATDASFNLVFQLSPE